MDTNENRFVGEELMEIDNPLPSEDINADTTLELPTGPTIELLIPTPEVDEMNCIAENSGFETSVNGEIQNSMGEVTDQPVNTGTEVLHEKNDVNAESELSNEEKEGEEICNESESQEIEKNQIESEKMIYAEPEYGCVAPEHPITRTEGQKPNQSSPDGHRIEEVMQSDTDEGEKTSDIEMYSIDPLEQSQKDETKVDETYIEQENKNNKELENTQDNQEIEEVRNTQEDQEHQKNQEHLELTSDAGTDAEICLLPDEERVISEADKARAIKVRQDADNNDARGSPDSAQNSSFHAQLSGESGILKAAPEAGIIKELDGAQVEEVCVQCCESNPSRFILVIDNAVKFLCTQTCLDLFLVAHPNKYRVINKKITIVQIVDSMQTCIACETKCMCRFRFLNASSVIQHICGMNCLKAFTSSTPDRYIIKRKRYLVDERNDTSGVKYVCHHCNEKSTCKYSFTQEDETLYICAEACLNLLVREQSDRLRIKRSILEASNDLVESNDTETGILADSIDGSMKNIVIRSSKDSETANRERELSFIRRCRNCAIDLSAAQLINSLVWETFDFCSDVCLRNFQNQIGDCEECRGTVDSINLGKYSVRFGFEVKQFCQSLCLNKYKKGIKNCSYCQKDIISIKTAFLASVGDKGAFRDFCSYPCMKHYENNVNPASQNLQGKCSVCSSAKKVTHRVVIEEKEHFLCSSACFSAFLYVTNITPDKCSLCTKFFERKIEDYFTLFMDTPTKVFCSNICLNLHIVATRKIVPCNWCKVKKYNFDMIHKVIKIPQNENKGSLLLFCSLNCLGMCEISVKAIGTHRDACDNCVKFVKPQYHLTMSDGSVRNFCCYQCVMQFQEQFGRNAIILRASVTQSTPVPASLPKRISTWSPQELSTPASSTTETLVRSVRSTNRIKSPSPAVASPSEDNVPSSISNVSSPHCVALTTASNIAPDHVAPLAVEIKTQIITVPPRPRSIANKATMCCVQVEHKGISCQLKSRSISTQTDSPFETKIIIPIPVPIYVPQPMYMYNMPAPVPVPIPIPIPVPIFIPTTRNSASGIMKEIKKIQDKIPTDPFEAELLMMAEMVAGEKKRSDSDSSDDEIVGPEPEYEAEVIENETTFQEDVLQMALKASFHQINPDYEEPAVDLESAMTANTITQAANSDNGITMNDGTNIQPNHQELILIDATSATIQNSPRTSGRKRQSGPTRSRGAGNSALKRQRRNISQILVSPSRIDPIREPIADKADANMCLKFTFGVNAWRQWILTKNTELEKSSLRHKLFTSDILQMTADELNYSLSLFVKEVRKPNGSEYAPDTIYYLVLGIQQHLYESGRIDNIFTDTYYEHFTESLDDVAKRFSVLYNDSQYIVTRVEEEHLWECKQLGAHSPHVLLSTLMFFNTKHFNLTTVEEHMQLSFSHIMKHWKRSAGAQGNPRVPGSRNVLLRFYPPPPADGNTRKKKVYEQQENEHNPLRCPVKLYEFYLSKCPESVKTRSDVFYLLPERSCVPDSPVWYSTQPLGRDALAKMLHRVKMVKEINIALLTC